MHTVFITGARGKTGAPLAREMIGGGAVRVVGGSSDPDLVDIEGLEAVSFSWDASRTWEQDHLTTADAIYVVRPDRRDAPELVRSMLQRTRDDAYVVLLSELDRGYFAPDDWSLRVEGAVRDSGRPWTILQPGWFMQVFSDERFYLPDIRESGVLPFPSSGQSVAFIDARDIAGVAARALTEEGHDGMSYELTGPEALDLERVAKLLSERIERSVEFEEQSLDDALGDSSGFRREIDFGAFDRIRRGLADQVTDTVELVTGRRPHTFEEFLLEEFSLAPPSS